MAETYAEEFVKLAFRLNKHISGLIDAYFGPDSLGKEVEAEGVVPLPALREKCRELAEMARADGEDQYLRTFREKQVDALAAQIDRLSGRATDYRVYVNRLFDIDLKPIDEAELDDYRQRVIALLGRLGFGGEPADAIRRWEEANVVSGDELARVVSSVCREARKRTLQIVSLPRGEKVTVEPVRNQPWSGYNWYKRRYRSLIQVNLDLPRTHFDAEDLAYHEAYPGHHTDHSCKEKALYRQRGLLDTSIQLINTPASVMAEGIASVAGRFIEEAEPDDDRQLAALLQRLRRGCDSTATIKLHAEGASKTAVAEYLEKRGLMTGQRAAKRLEFLTNPLWSSYSFTYWFGARIIGNAFKQARAANREREFYHLLYNELLTPTILGERLRTLC